MKKLQIRECKGKKEMILEHRRVEENVREGENERERGKKNNT